MHVYALRRAHYPHARLSQGKMHLRKPCLLLYDTALSSFHSVFTAILGLGMQVGRALYSVQDDLMDIIGYAAHLSPVTVTVTVTVAVAAAVGTCDRIPSHHLLKFYRRRQRETNIQTHGTLEDAKSEVVLHKTPRASVLC